MKLCSNIKARKQSNSKDFGMDDQPAIHHWPRAEKVIGQPQLTLLVVIVPRCNQSQSDSLRAMRNTLMGSKYTYCTSCPSALWRGSCHCWDAKLIAELERGWIFTLVALILISYVNTFGLGNIYQNSKDMCMIPT